jgi:CP family cyanate transporter-like MFS transporter
VIRGRIAALLGILLVALSLRTAVASLSPIADQVSHDVPLSALTLGVIGAAPPIIFALAGFFVPRLVRALGLDATILVASITMTVGLLLRALAPNTVVLVVSTVIALIGAGIGNITLPPAVKRYFPDRIAPLTSAYSVLLSIGTALPALLAVPVATGLGWRASLAVWFVVAAFGIAPWIVSAVSQRRIARAAVADADVVPPEVVGRMSRSGIAWAIAVTFAVSSINVYAAFAWLPKLLVQTAGQSPGAAGALLSLYAIMGLPVSLLIPFLATRVRPVGILIFTGVVGFVASDIGLIFAPAAAPILWILLGGVGQLLFPLSLYLINARTRTHAGSAALSGFVQAIGYTIAVLSPILFGLFEQWTGGWTVSLVFLMVLTLIAVPAGFVLSRPHFVEDDLTRRITS